MIAPQTALLCNEICQKVAKSPDIAQRHTGLPISILETTSRKKPASDVSLYTKASYFTSNQEHHSVSQSVDDGTTDSPNNLSQD